MGSAGMVRGGRGASARSVWRGIWLGVCLGLAGCQRSAESPDTRLSPEVLSSATPSEVATAATVTAPAAPLSEEAANQDVAVGANGDSADAADADPAELPDNLDFSRPVSLSELRRQRDETVWKNERLAQEYESALVRLWDRLIQNDERKGGDPFAVLAAQPLGTLRVGEPGDWQSVVWNVRKAVLGERPQELDDAGWGTLLASLRERGFRIVQTEWHHARFDPQPDGSARSAINLSLYGRHEQQPLRWVVTGEIQVTWRSERDADGLPVPARVDATRLMAYEREGEVAFREVLTVDHAQADARSGVQPVHVEDLDGDGLPEILAVGSNEIFWNRGQMRFEKEPFSSHWERGFEAGLLADLNGDGRLDYLRPGLAGDLLLYLGDERGRFSQEPLGRARGGGPLKQPQVIAAGDIDKDGDLDVWIGQYKISYVGGQMPSPYYDANDGFPAWLLLNDGTGRFEPATEEAGLAAKRNRRSYGGSFVDLDEDGDLDLLVVSDFAGVDVYYNNGKGYFTDVTDASVDERHLFGMAATFSDYNVDGKLDFFVSGMASTTARRLEQMRLGRRDRADIHMMRSRMGYGNRMYLAQGDGQTPAFAQPAFRDEVARTGWTWGASSLDVDNDRFPEIYVANGHSSGASTKDHCSHFWCHDIYDGTSEPNRDVLKVFNDSMKGYYDRSESWDGYQKNALLVNRGGESFVNLGFLMGVGDEYDGRAVISNDLDRDGRMDLLVVEDRWRDGQLLHVYRNELPAAGHWIGLQLVERPGKESPLGATVMLTEADGKRRIGVVVAGDSIHAQHATEVHFGLGSATEVQRVEIRLSSGRVETLEKPAVDRYHRVDIP